MQERQRRRSRTFAPEMLSAVRELLSTGASSREVVQAVARKQAEGELDGLAVPSESTVKAIAREQPVDSETWTLEDGDAEMALRVLSAVQRKSHGRVRHLTKREARIAAVILGLYQSWNGQASEALAWRAYVRAREYLAAMHRGDDPAAIHLGLFDAAQLDAATAGSASPAR